MIKLKSKQLLSMILAVCMLVPALATGFIASYAAETGVAAVAAGVDPDEAAGEETTPTEPPAYDPKTATIGQYTADQLDTSLLIRHTGKGSEIIEDVNKIREACDPNNYESSEEYSQYFNTTTSSQDVYKKMKFDYNTLQSNAKSYAADANSQDPLAGFSTANPNELLIGDCNRYKDFETYLHTYNDVKYLSDVPDNNFDSLAKSTDDIYFIDDDNEWNTACSNGIGVDVDGDGTDELAYFSLQQKETDNNNMQKGSYIRVQLYDRVPNGSGYKWSMIDEYHTIMQGTNYVHEYTPIHANKSYVSLAAGDFDGDGKQELAYYMPDKKDNDDALDARVVIEKFSVADGSCSHTQLASFYLTDMCEDYGKMGTREFLPQVALSTTSTRLGDVVNATSNGAKRYHTYDDLVVSVSVPINTYQNDDINKNSITAIFGLKDDQYQKLFQYEYKPFRLPEGMDDIGNDPARRMYAVNSCDADLNGDGFKEIFVAGFCQFIQHSTYSEDNSNGKLDAFRVGANIISYNNIKGCYEMVWDEPIVLDHSKQKNTYLVLNFSLTPPIALCAGHFMAGTLDLKDQVFINGFIYDLKNTKMSGKPLYYSYNSKGQQTNYIPDTLSGYDKENFPGGYGDDAVKFEEEYYYDMDALTSEGGWYDSCAAGNFVNGSGVDEIAVIGWDCVEDYFFDISILSFSQSTGTWEVKAHNNYSYIDYLESKKYGSSLFVSFIDSEEDTAVYRWMGTYCSYSSPVLYSIMQAPPYYKEANGMYAYDCNIIVGNSEDSAVDWSAGVGVEGTLGVEFLKIFSAEVTIGGEATYLNNATWSDERELSKGLDGATERDCAVCYVTPFVVNVYEVYQVRPTAEELAASDEAYAKGSSEGRLERSVVQYSMPKEPEFSMVPIEDYNEAVRMQNDPDQPDDTKLKEIDVNALPKSTAGDPVAYYHTLKRVLGTDTIDNSATQCGTVRASVTNNPDLELAETEMQFSHGTTEETGGALGASFSVKVGSKIGPVKFDVSPSLSGEYAKSSGTGSMDAVSFGTSYYLTTAENQLLGSLNFVGSDNKGNENYEHSDVVITHYDPENGDWYNYNAGSVCFRTNYEGGAALGVFAHGFYTEPCATNYEEDVNLTPVDLHYKYPPEQPMGFSVKSVRKHDDGSLDVTLIWDVSTRNKNRKTDGYNIYMADTNENLKSYIHLQNKDGLLTPQDPTARYMTYSITLEPNDYRDEDLNFYIAPAYQDASDPKRVLEGTIGAMTTISDVADINNTMVITKQPETYYMSDDGSNETATFSIEAKKADDFNPSNGTVSFIWMVYDPKTGEWETQPTQKLTDDDASDGTFRSTFTIDIDGSKKESYKDTGVRCLVSCSNSTVSSDIVAIEMHAPEYEAKIDAIENGTASFEKDSAVTQSTFKPGDKVNVYLSLAYKTCISDYSVKSTDGSESVPISFESQPVLNGDRWESSYSFIMPSKDVTVSIVTAGCVTATIDTSGNVYADDGTPVAYIELKHFQGPYFNYQGAYFSADPLLIPLGEKTIRGRYIYDMDHKPKYVTVKGASSGTVYQTLYWEGDVTFNDFNVSLSQQPVEDLIVIPCFENSEPVEPTTVEPTTVEPTTVEPTTVEPTTVAPTTVEPTTVEPTTVEPTTVEPTTEPTTNPEPSEHGISTYEELVAFAQSVNGGNNFDSAFLETNIIAPEGSVWSQPIGTDDKPFMGTFDGKGYGIISLNVNCGDNGGLFGVIGESGTVKDLMVIDCDFAADSTYAGGIAAVNNGTIDHCTSGVNMPANLKIKLPSGKKITPADYNSLVTGTYAGGIAAINNGTITGTRSGAFVSGVNCGGVAAQNNGRIYGCANNGAVGSTYKSCEKSGGIAAENSGSIGCSYNSGKVFCGNAANLGAIVGSNSSADVTNSFYSDLNSLNPVGSGTAIDSTNKLVKDETMLTSSFVDTLNGVTDDTLTWRQSKYGDTYFNEGYPTIEGRFLQNRALNLMNGMTLKGMMHGSLQINLAEADKDSEEYQALAQQAGSGATVYNAVTTDENGNYIPAELWIAGGLTLSVPVKSADAKLLTVNENNEIVTVEPDSVENGVATFTVASPNTFAVTDAAPQPTEETTTQPATEATSKPAEATSQPSNNDATSSTSTKDSATKDSSNGTSSSNGTVKTGEAVPVLIVLALAASFCGIMLIRRKQGTEQR